MNVKPFALFILFSLLLSLEGCGPGTRQPTGAVVGGIAGGLAGSQVGGGKGKTAATILGAVLGAMLGSSIGEYMDDVDKLKVASALQNTNTGVTTTWINHGGYNYVTPTNGFTNNNGQLCRPFQIKIIVDGNYETGGGTACRRPDGYWNI